MWYNTLKLILSHLERGERVWVGSLVLYCNMNLSLQHQVALAKMLQKKYPDFSKQLLESVGAS